MKKKYDFTVRPPDLQVSLSHRLQVLRTLFLGEALRGTVEADDFPLGDLDVELSALVPRKSLNKLAGLSLRGEVIFPVPILLQRNPYLLGYYRLLYGFSQKEFYRDGYGQVRAMEDKGRLNPASKSALDPLCRSLIQTGTQLVDALEPVSLSLIHDLQVLTLGAQLRGAHNVNVGQEAVQTVSSLFRSMLLGYKASESKRTMTFHNDSNLAVEIHYGSDPDVGIIQRLSAFDERKLVAIEVKGGTDYSNVWNRLGEAEKSHRTAKRNNFNELWTVTAVDLDASPEIRAKAAEKSPTTTQFFFLPRILSPDNPEGKKFRDYLGSILGATLK